MSDTPFLTRHLKDETESLAFGRAIGQLLQPGDAVALNGALGAGKTTLARGAIRALLHAETDVPSPTFTLVQTYDLAIGELWHVDLYRIESEDELEALGLEDAFGDAILLIEWPDRLGARLPHTTLHLELSTADSDGRVVHLTGASPWADRLKDLSA